MRISIGEEKTKLQWFEIVRQWVTGKGYNNIMTDSVLIVDTHYDKQLVMEHSEDDQQVPKGIVPVTDREKLFRLLRYLKNTNNYRYILMDIFLDKAVIQPADSSLYQLIASMPRIGISSPPEHPLAENKLDSKAGRVQYGTTIWENDFVKYSFIVNDEKSLPLKMYEELSGHTLRKTGPLYWDGWHLVRSNAILTYSFIEDDDVRDNRMYLGLSLVGDSVNSAEYISLLSDSEFAKDKYVLIGDFEDDVHNTFIGEMSGTAINFNAFLSLLAGCHHISLFTLFFIFVLFWALVYLTLSDFKFARMFMWIGYPAYLLIACFFIYIAFHDAYDVLAASFLFYALQNTVEIIQNKKAVIKKMNNIKNKITSIWKKTMKSPN